MTPRPADNGREPGFHYFHFVYSVRFIQKYLILTLLPLVRALLAWELPVFWQALRQSAGLLIFLASLALARGLAAGWQLDDVGCLHLRSGILLRRRQQLPPGTLAAIQLDRPLRLRLLGAAALTLYPARTARLRPVTLYLTRRDAAALADRLLPAPDDAPCHRAAGMERLYLALLGANAASTALVLLAAWRQTRRLGGWAEQVARAGLTRALELAAVLLPVGTAWLLAGVSILLLFSLLRSYFRTELYKLYYSERVILTRSGLLRRTETRISVAAVTACDIRATPTARLLRRWPVYLVAGSYRGTLPVLLLRPGRAGEAARLAALLPGAVLPPAGRCSTKGRSLPAFLLWPGVLAGGAVLAAALAVRFVPALAPAFLLPAGAALLLLGVAWDGRRRECVARTDGRLTACVVRHYTLHCWCFFCAPGAADFRQNPWAFVHDRGNLILTFAAGLRVKIKSVPRRAAWRALP